MNRINDTLLPGISEMLSDQSAPGLSKVLEVLLNQVMLFEREKHLKAASYERTELREGYANGFKDKQLKTRVGELSLSVPQTRDSDFYPSCLEKGLRCERALKLALAEMYVQGVSTRKVAKITEELCGFEISSQQVSRASGLLDKELDVWRNRPLDSYPYLILDARYEKIRHGGTVVDCAVLLAIAVHTDGKRHVLGCSVSLSEAEVHWRDFLNSLVKRGLHGVQLITSDAHAGLGAARKSVFPSVPWQRCQFHLQQNAQQYVPKKSMKEEVAEDVREIFNAKNLNTANEMLKKFVSFYEEKAPDLAQWAESNIPESLTVMNLPKKHQRRLRTSNSLERLNREILRRTRVATLFPNSKSCLRLVSAVLAEVDQDWQTGKIYLNM